MKKNFINIFLITIIIITSSSVNAIPKLDIIPEVQIPSITTKPSIYERLLKERIILLNKEITDELVNSIVGQMLYLESEDKSKPIYLYINSPGGNVFAGLAIYDTMNQIEPDIITVNIGVAASMGGFLLAAGTSGQRFALKKSRVMLHQPTGGYQEQAIDIEIQAKEILYLKKQLNHKLAKMTGQSIEKILEDTEQDFWLSAQEAKEYGIVDSVIDSLSQLKQE